MRHRHVYVADDIALLLVDRVIEGTGTDGTPSTSKAQPPMSPRPDPAGNWRYIIDNPFGTA